MNGDKKGTTYCFKRLRPPGDALRRKQISVSGARDILWNREVVCLSVYSYFPTYYVQKPAHPKMGWPDPEMRYRAAICASRKSQISAAAGKFQRADQLRHHGVAHRGSPDRKDALKYV